MFKSAPNPSSKIKYPRFWTPCRLFKLWSFIPDIPAIFLISLPKVYNGEKRNIAAIGKWGSRSFKRGVWGCYYADSSIIRKYPRSEPPAYTRHAAIYSIYLRYSGVTCKMAKTEIPSAGGTWGSPSLNEGLRCYYIVLKGNSRVYRALSYTCYACIYLIYLQYSRYSCITFIMAIGEILTTETIWGSHSFKSGVWCRHWGAPTKLFLKRPKIPLLKENGRVSGAPRIHVGHLYT